MNKNFFCKLIKTSSCLKPVILSSISPLVKIFLISTTFGNAEMVINRISKEAFRKCRIDDAPLNLEIHPYNV